MKTFGWGQGRLTRYMGKLASHQMLDTRLDTPFLVIRIENYDKYQTRLDTPSDTRPDTGLDTVYIEKERKRKKRRAPNAPALQMGAAPSAPNLAAEFLRLRKVSEYSQLPDDEIRAMITNEQFNA